MQYLGCRSSSNKSNDVGSGLLSVVPHGWFDTLEVKFELSRVVYFRTCFKRTYGGTRRLQIN